VIDLDQIGVARTLYTALAERTAAVRDSYPALFEGVCVSYS